ncbi:unnamed protein product [Heligmosomoides polygyrus]|uniref:Formate dehydrogenase n=1 Tax=Heligmosomoides polygyrus TaxID=6339 RepID=A0A183FHL7_HELPZ|nr:unnamed protein product [Heligmosomoides polygyrus]
MRVQAYVFRYNDAVKEPQGRPAPGPAMNFFNWLLAVRSMLIGRENDVADEPLPHSAHARGGWGRIVTKVVTPFRYPRFTGQ